MARKTPTRKVNAALERLAAPFWEKVREAGLDGYFIERLLRALLRRWREDRFARVKQGGLHGDARAELSRVFVDLDVGVGENPERGASARVVASWMWLRSGDLRSPRRLPSGGSHRAQIPLEVLLGGPGQGKSTVGRFLSLIHGAILLLTAPLAGIVPGTGTPAEFKLHAVYSVRAGGLDDLATSAGSVHDTVGFDPDWVRAALYIWDLGYQDYDRFVAAVLAGAVPLQRLKDKLNPVVLAHYDADGKRHPLRGPGDTPLRLEDACAGGDVPTEGTLDFDVVIQDSQGRKVEARVVCVPHQQQDRWYLTTLPRTCFTPFDVAEIYRVRWEVELFFRDLKGAVRLDEVTRLSNPSSLRVALLASLIAATLGQELTRSLNTAHASLPGTEPEPNVIETLPRSPQVSPARPSASFSPLSTARPGRRGERRRTG
jgi:hypothetical protein